MGRPESISTEVFELYKKVIDLADKYDKLFKNIESKTKSFDDIVYDLESFARSVKDQLLSFIDKTRFEIDKSLEIYSKEKSKVSAFIDKIDTITNLHKETETFRNELNNLRSNYKQLTSQINESFQKFNLMLDSINEKSNSYLNKTIEKLTSKIDQEISAKVDRDLKNLETQILIRHKILEGRVVEINNLLISTITLVEQVNKMRNNNLSSNNNDDLSNQFDNIKNLDKITQKHINISSEIEFKLDQISATVKDFETRIVQEKKEIKKLYDELLEKDSNDFNKLRDKISNFSSELEKLEKDLKKSKNIANTSIFIAILAILLSIIISIILK
jgi:archaellum component FlaC